MTIAPTQETEIAANDPNSGRHPEGGHFGPNGEFVSDSDHPNHETQDGPGAGELIAAEDLVPVDAGEAPEPDGGSFKAEYFAEHNFDESQLEMVERIWNGETVREMVDSGVPFSQQQLYRLRRTSLQVKSQHDDPAGEDGVAPTNNDEGSTEDRPERRQRTGQRRQIQPQWVWARETIHSEFDEEGKPTDEGVETGAMFFFDGAAIVHIDVAENPHRVTGRKPNYGLPRNERYDLYENDMTVQQYIEKGGEIYDIRSDVVAGNIHLEGPACDYMQVNAEGRDVIARITSSTATEEDVKKAIEIYKANGTELAMEDFIWNEPAEAETAADETATAADETATAADETATDDEDTSEEDDAEDEDYE